VEFFQGMDERMFPEGPATVKVHFTNSEPKKKHFSTEKFIAKYQISKSRGVQEPPGTPLATPMDTGNSGPTSWLHC